MSGKVSTNDPGRDLFASDTDLLNRCKTLVRWFHRWNTSRKHEDSLLSITIYPPSGTRPKWLFVAKRGLRWNRQVGFWQSAAPITGLNAMFDAMAKDTLKWHEDKYNERWPQDGD